MLRFNTLGFKSDKPGFNHWWAQRLSAVGLAITGIWFLILLLQDRPFAYDAARLWFRSPWHYALSLLFSLSLLIHFYFGLEKIVNDYVHDERLHRVIMHIIMVWTWVGVVGCVGFLTIVSYSKLTPSLIAN
jgi:succinate dehydrogenase / fumarate reductase membrane anchor subunit